MDEKETKVLEKFKEMREHGFGQILIKFDEDDKVVIYSEKWKKNPSQLDVETAVNNTLSWGFGSVETFEVGKIAILKQVRKMRI